MSLRRARARRASWLPLAIALLFAIPGGPARGADETSIPAPTGFVNDHAGVLDARTIRLVRERSTILKIRLARVATHGLRDELVTVQRTH